VYTTKQVSKLTGWHWRTVSRKCQVLGCQKIGTVYAIDDDVLEKMFAMPDRRLISEDISSTTRLARERYDNKATEADYRVQGSPNRA
jgi:hypothetical protein